MGDFKRSTYTQSQLHKIRWMMLRAELGEQLHVLWECSVRLGVLVGTGLLTSKEANDELYSFVGLLMSPGYSIEGAVKIIEVGLKTGSSDSDSIEDAKRKSDMVDSMMEKMANSMPVEINKDGYRCRMIKK